MKFTEFPLHECILKGIEEAKFIDCTPVQEKSLQKSLKGIDVSVQSQTGSGKTAAFLVTIFNLFLEPGRYANKKALVIVPTRELAVQVESDAQLIGKYCGLRMGCFYGGVGYDKQEKLLKEGVNLYIGTPGRLIDFYKSGKLDLKGIDILVIDEADRMFDMGFIPDVRYMAKRMPPPGQRLTMLYSATLDYKVKQLAWEYMKEPAEIEIEPEHITVETITQELYHIGSDEKFKLLLGLLKRENPKSCLIFTNTKRMAEIVSRKLSANGYENDYISGDLPQKQRLKIIDAIKAGKTEILVATDVAARGLHIEGLDLVINYDLPEDCEGYVHRIGRTARAGRTGKAISLACERYVFSLESIEKLINMKIPTIWETDGLLLEDRGGRVQLVTTRDRERRPERRDRDWKKKPERGKRRGTPEQRPKSPQREARRARPPARPAETVREAEQSRQHARQPQSAREALRSRHHARPPESARGAPPARPKKDVPIEERLELYKEKYGDRFAPAAGKAEAKKEQPAGLLSRLKGLFKNKS
jgi:ATP-dependent RNA helicase RhlB